MTPPPSKPPQKVPLYSLPGKPPPSNLQPTPKLTAQHRPQIRNRRRHSPLPDIPPKTLHLHARPHAEHRTPGPGLQRRAHRGRPLLHRLQVWLGRDKTLHPPGLHRLLHPQWRPNSLGVGL
jgi:hypothetical protein